MNEREKELFKNLCSFKLENYNEELLKNATPEVLGHLFFNRMQAVAYGSLSEGGLLGKVNREFCNSLKAAYDQNRVKNKSFFRCIEYLEILLSRCNGPYAMLKGAYLCKRYPDGYRTSNDIDLLVHPKAVTEIGNVLLENGFRQGYIREGKFVPATRQEIITSKMMRGETVPYIKDVNLPGMQYLEVDINFSLDYKPGDTNILEQMLRNAVVEEINGLRVRTLSQDDFFVHLCAHLYKEATTLPWVEMMRDMTLYKYCDIYMLLNDATKHHIDLIFNRSKELGMEKVCAFAILQTSALFCFDSQYAIDIASAVLKEDPEFIHTVVSPKDKKTYVFIEKDIGERFFTNNRKALLQEVI